MTSVELMAALGRAVAAVWGDLPKDVQRTATSLCEATA